jgi:cell division protein FtsA
MPNIITGLDIGSSFIKGIVAEKRKNGTLTVLTAFKQKSAGMRRGVLADFEESRGVFADLSRELKAVHKSATQNVFVNAGNEHIKVRISRGISAVGQPDKEIKQEDVDRAIQSSRATKILPNYKVLHTIIREFLVDDIGDIQTPIGMTGSRIEVSTLIVESFSPHIDTLMQALSEAGMSVGGVIFKPLAASRAVLSKQQKELGVALVDFGAGTTSLAVYEEQKPLHAKTLAIGSGHITNDIAIGLKLPVEIAEKLKREYGSASSKKVSRKDTIKYAHLDPSLANETSRRFLSEIIEVRLAEIMDIVNNELVPLQERFQFPAGIVATGGGVKIEGLTDLIRSRMKLPVQIGMPHIDAFEVENPTHEAIINDPEFVTAAGLVLVGSDEEKPAGNNILRSVKKIVRNLIP